MAPSMEKFPHSEDAPKVMSLQLLKKITNNFSKERKVGSGTYGEVYKGVHNGIDIAVKRLHLTPGLDDGEQFKEFENLLRLRHQNIVQLLGYCYETRHEYVYLNDGRTLFAENINRALCFEYMHNSSLQNHLYDEHHGFDWQTRYKIIKGTCEGLKYLHEGLESPIYHLDLKPDNILLDKNMVPKLADFGLSKLVLNDKTQATQSPIGTWGYLPPEYIESKLISKKLDIFSLGVVMIRVIAGYEGYIKKDEMSSKEFVELVQTNWRSRLNATPGCISLQYESHQVKRCIEIALDCVKDDRNQRPEIGTIVHWLNETEHMTETLVKNIPPNTRHGRVSHVDKVNSSDYILVDEVRCTTISASPSLEEMSLTKEPSKIASELSKVGFIQDNLNASNFCSASVFNPGSSPYNPESQGKEYNLILYMHQIISGPKHNQVNIADPKQSQMFGYTNVHDYPIYDSLGHSATIVARAQGLHTETDKNCSDWFHWSSIVFPDERSCRSSLVAMGNQEGEWAIVGGTGVFAFAKGTISVSRIEDDGSSNNKEVRICAFCCTPMTIMNETKLMPFEDLSIKDDSSAASNVGSPSMINLKCGPITPQSQETEYNLNLYMHQTINGENRNQVNIADPKQPRMFGYTNVHDYPIYDSNGPDAKIIARAQGLHAETSMNYNDWFHWSSIVFINERFKGSSLMAIGNLTHEGEWAIVGGTGVFTFAQGTISIDTIQREGSSNTKVLRIRAFCHTTHITSTETKPFKRGLIKDDSRETFNFSISSMDNPRCGRGIPDSQGMEYNLHLYMHQTIDGSNHNQVNIADPKQPLMFGFTNVHDYPLYDSLGRSAKIVARAQGLDTETSMNYNDWFHWSNIKFTDERFRGARLVAIGNQTHDGEWAIIGGTGMFAFAQGTMSLSEIQSIGSSNVKEIEICALCCTPKTFLFE